MCGLVGVAGDTTGNWRDVFKELLLIDSVRGMHSTGAAFVSRVDSKMSIVKRVGHPFNLLVTDEFYNELEKGPYKKVLIGHNRHATFGDKTEANAHPFQFEHVVGAHNGTLEKHSLWHLKDDGKEYDTDSEGIFAKINKVGAKETMKDLYGAWALTWYDKLQDTLNFLNNGKRPLHYCYSLDRCTIIWASEASMLKYVFRRYNKKMFEDKVYSVPQDKQFSWKVPNSNNVKWENPIQDVVEGKAYAASSVVPFGVTGSHTVVHDTRVQKNTTTSTIRSLLDYSKRTNTKKFRPPYRDDYHHTLNKQQFFSVTEGGCAFCQDKEIKWGEFIKLMGPYQGNLTSFMCEACYNDEPTFEYLNYAI